MVYRHARLAATLREEITRGTYRPGDQLPSSYELAETYNVGRYSARAALQSLIDDGIAVSHRRHGTYVAGAPSTNRNGPPRIKRTHSIRRLAPAEAPTPGTDDLETIETSQTSHVPPADVALTLDLDPNQAIHTTRDVFTDDSGPLGIRTTYTHDTAPARQIITHTSVRPPTEAEAGDIDHPPVVLVHDETHLTTGPVRLIRTVYRPEVRLADQYQPRT